MLTVLSLANELKPLVPCAFMGAASVPHFTAAVGWGIVSRFIPENWFRFVDDKMYSLYQRLVLFCFENISGVKLVFYGDTKEIFEKKENVLYISNHQSSVDWVVADMLAVRQGSLGHLRYILKDTLQYVPLYGWYFYHHGCVYVRRGKKFRYDITKRGLEYLRTSSNPGWVIIFPEGTRFSTSKTAVKAKTEAYCSQNGIATPFQHVFSPRTKGLLVTLKTLRNRFTAVYDVTIAYSQSFTDSGTRIDAPDMFEFVCCKPKEELHVHVSRIPISEIPNEEDIEGIEGWLRSRFVEKEKLLSDFSKSGHFPNVQDSDSALSVWHTIPVVFLWCSVLVPITMTKFGRRLFFLTWISGSVGSVLWMKLKRAA